jgi:hypothetical protein
VCDFWEFGTVFKEVVQPFNTQKIAVVVGTNFEASVLLTAHLALVVNSCAMKRCIVRCSIIEDSWFHRAVFGPTLIFVLGISTPLRGLIM